MIVALTFLEFIDKHWADICSAAGTIVFLLVLWWFLRD